MCTGISKIKIFFYSYVGALSDEDMLMFAKSHERAFFYLLKGKNGTKFSIFINIFTFRMREEVRYMQVTPCTLQGGGEEY